MQGTFRGVKKQKIDTKGRVSIPSAFRKVLESGDPERSPGEDPNLIIVHGTRDRKFLEGYSQDAMDRVEAKIATLPSGKAKRAMTQLYVTETTDMRVDSTGRIVLPKDLRERLGLAESDDLTFAGTGDTFQIWKASAYDEEVGSVDLEDLEEFEPDMDMNDLLDLLTGG
ncbi:division/cell wall cluster transcriptional repressor MraZ [Poseidonocella sp. HB161398]|uniref:division/cell wall cluster transcriptional repressor MraZ n=1 Tax=Poseidonocella sp. HB161398 TaxID=2320855 RepID=UPI001F0DE4AF|nr:AbrB/MazE/SpoVT family DNA-binding domain-containing protein [Poseidonocella sp. HB161398]